MTVQEILPGVWHWTSPHPNLGGVHVSSYWLEDGGVLIDPLVPEEGVEWLAGRPTQPAAIVLCNRHHYRDSARLQERFGCQVHAPAAGMHAFDDERSVIPYEPGEVLPGGLAAVAVGALSPDDSGLHLAPSGALWLADTVVRSATDPASRIGWVLDQLMDDPPQTKRALLAAYTRLLDELDFEHLLLAHGLPLVGDGRTRLEQLVHDGGRTAADAFE